MRIIFYLFILLYFTSTARAASDYFVSHGQKTYFTYDQHRAAEINLSSQIRGIKGFKEKDRAIFDKLIPVEFASGATGLLTNRITVQLKEGRTDFFLTETNLKVRSSLKKGLFYIETLSPENGIKLAQKLSADYRVKFAHPIFHFAMEARARKPQDEPLFHIQRHLKNDGQRGATPGADINILPAWDVTEGHSDIKVAVIDLGFEQDHPDLDSVWAINTKEIPNNRKDDDGNGLIDDVKGWNFTTRSHKLIYGAANSHGTATAGLLAAPANGIGVSGVCPRCKVLPLVIYSDIEHATEAFYYARSQGVRVISNSWGYGIGTPRTELLEQAITDVALESHAGRGTSILFAMPNHNRNACRSTAPDISAHPHVIAISSVDKHDRKIEESGFGSCLQFVGPTGGGKDDGLTTTDRVGDKGYNRSTGITHEDLDDYNYTQSFYGTSAATPVVAGIFSLLYAQDQTRSAEDVLHIVRATADKVQPEEANYSSGHSDQYGYGRPNAGRALNYTVEEE